MIDSYFAEKLALYNRESRVACPEGCPRYGCRSDLLVTVSLLETTHLARFLGHSVVGLFSGAIRIAPAAIEGLGNVHVRFVVNKPCSFLEGSGLCAVYAVRPAVCALFPEHLGLLDEAGRKTYILAQGVGHYPCIEEGGFHLMPAREAAITRLSEFHARELMADEIYLFGSSGYSVDLRAIVTDLWQCGPGATVPFPVVGKALTLFMEETGLRHRIEEHLALLDTDRGVENYLAALMIAEELTARVTAHETGPIMSGHSLEAPMILSHDALRKRR